jgi:hypothetical protein
MRWRVWSALVVAWFTLGACGLEATPRPPREADPTLSEEPANPASYLDQDLPPPPRTMEITRRALSTISDPNLGFVGWVSTVSDCYDRLDPNDVEGRTYCLQMDSIAWSLEHAVPPEWQARDAEANDYFTDARFNERQMQFAPPADASLRAEAQERRKAEALQALRMMRNMAMEEAVRDLESNGNGGEGPGSTEPIP